MNPVDNCTTIQEYSTENVDLPAIQILFIALYSLVWIAAFAGNTMVLYVVAFNQISLNVRSVFIGCLAVSDLLMCMTSLPITAVTIFVRNWIFPSMFCKLIGIFQGGSIFVSSFTLTMIAIDRCLLIAKPSREMISYNRAVVIVIGIWVLGYSLALPTGLFSKEIKYPDICGEFCEESWPDYNELLGRSNQRRVYGITVLLLQFGIPAVISTICYTMISRVMDRQVQRRRCHALLAENEQKLVSRKNRANRMMIAMVVGFILAWIPLNLINLYRDMSTFTMTPWFSVIFAFCHVSAMMSAVANPVIYSWFNPQFRGAIQQCWRRYDRKGKPLTGLRADGSGSKFDYTRAFNAVVSTTAYEPGDQFL